MFQRLAMLSCLLLASLILLSQAWAADPVEGQDYQLIDPPAATHSGDRIEVVEVFGYSCPHCAHFAPLMAQWKARQPEDVKVEYMAAAFGGIWEVYARIFYTADTMGVGEDVHQALFKALHEDHRPINSIEDIADFYAEHGVDKAQFMSTLESFPVDSKLADARARAVAMGVEATPTMVVAGKYRVTAPRDGGFQRMLEITDFLVAKERAAAKSANL